MRGERIFAASVKVARIAVPNANRERYGLITQPPGSPYNPDGFANRY